MFTLKNQLNILKLLLKVKHQDGIVKKVVMFIVTQIQEKLY